MKFLIVFAVFVTCFATDPHPHQNPMNKIPGLSDAPECKALLDLGEAAWVVPNCDEHVQTCIKEVHALAPKCVAKHYKYWKDNKPEVYECFHKPEMESLKKSWFGISCQWHNALIKCLKGEEAGEEFEIPEEVNITDEQHKENQEFIMNYFRKASEKAEPGIHSNETCIQVWQDKIKECKHKAQSCPNYPACSGEGGLGAHPSDVIKTWNTITSRLAKKKMRDMRENISKASECMKLAGIEENP